ncbi:MAG TPA: hypothetical protein VE978_17065 [Chitinophagales bacterium]|nr:hypothetical protein [Chitinophagales bacterium]
MKKAAKNYTLDELGELIVPHHLTNEEAQEISEAIREHKKRTRMKPPVPFKLNIPSVFLETQKVKHIFSEDDLLEQIRSRPLTKADERAISDAIKAHKKGEQKKLSTSKSSPSARSLDTKKNLRLNVEAEMVSEPPVIYKKTK